MVGQNQPGCTPPISHISFRKGSGYLTVSCQETSEKVGASAMSASVAVKQEASNATIGSKTMERNEANVSMAEATSIWRE